MQEWCILYFKSSLHYYLMKYSPRQKLFISKLSTDLKLQTCFESCNMFLALSNCINPAAAILRHQSRDSADKLFLDLLQR